MFVVGFWRCIDKEVICVSLENICDKLLNYGGFFGFVLDDSIVVVR